MDMQTYRHTEIEATMDTRHRTKENKTKVIKMSYMDTIPCAKVKHHNFVGTIF